MDPRDIVRRAFLAFMNASIDGLLTFEGTIDAEVEKWVDEYFEEPTELEIKTNASYVYLAFCNLIEASFPRTEVYDVEFHEDSLVTENRSEFVDFVAEGFTSEFMPLPDFEK